MEQIEKEMTIDEDRHDPRDGHMDGRTNNAVLYGVEDVPSAGLCFLFGLQQAIMTIGGTISIPFILTPLICADGKAEVTSRLLSITMFMCGLATILQCLLGVRLGIIQGGSHTFVAPIVALLSLEKWKCPTTSDAGVSTNTTEEDWQLRMREIQGSLMVASLTQLVLGCSGLLGFVMQFIGPLSIAPTITLIGLSLTTTIMDMNKQHIGLAVFAMVLTLTFTLYMANIKIPLPKWTLKHKWQIVQFPVFQLFPVILSICISWIFAYILTATDLIPTNSTARTDARLDVLENVPWFYWPTPFQFGTPTVSGAGYIALLAATLSSILESVGDYFSAARISGASPPPGHAVNRGIAIEGLASIVSGMMGAGHGTTSYSGNIGAIGITKVASRSVFMTAGCILIVCGVIGKLGAVFSLIPEPILGGTLTVLLGMVAAVGVSTLKFIDMDSTRNLTILGVSLLLGLMVPQYVNDPANADVISTGNEEFDSVVKVFLGTAMIVGGVVGFVLDNTVPGSYEERGILRWRQSISGENNNSSSALYDLPYITKYIKKVNCCTYVPFSPAFDKEFRVTCSCCACCRNDVTKSNDIDIPVEQGYQNRVALDNVEFEDKVTSKKRQTHF